MKAVEGVERVDRIAGSSVLVTGASGFIGTHICRQLLACRARVHAVSREPRRSQVSDLQWWRADLADISAVRKVFKTVKPEIVFHLASYVVGARGLEAVMPTFQGNLASTVNLLTAATEEGCRRIVLASSSEEPRTLSDTTFPCSPYAAAKLASSIYGRMFYQLYQTPVVIPRIFMTYGPNQKDLQKLVPFVICRLLRGEAPKLSSGRRLADWIYIDDVVEGLLRASVITGIEGCMFDLGSGSLVSVRGIVEQIVEIVGGKVEPEFNALSDRPFEQERAAETSFLSDKLGYNPKTAMSEGLAATVAWYRQRVGETSDRSLEEVGACEGLSPSRFASHGLVHLKGPHRDQPESI
jgi:UDP-glucose 4-epimerase